MKYPRPAGSLGHADPLDESRQFERDRELFRLASEGMLMMSFREKHELHRRVLGLQSNYTGSQLARYLYATPDPQPGEPGEGEPPPVEEPEEGEEEKDPAA